MKVPTYESQKTPSAQGPTPGLQIPSIRPVSPGGVEINPRALRIKGEGVSAQGKVIEDLGVRLGDLSDHFAKLRDKSQHNRAMVSLVTQFTQLHEQAVQDPDVWNAPQKAHGQLQKIVEETAKGIDSETERENFKVAAAFELDGEWKSLHSALLKRQVNEAKDAHNAATTSLEKKFYSSASPGERENIKGQIQAVFQDAVLGGYMTQGRAAHGLEVQFKRMRIGQVQSDGEIDPGGTLQNLKAGPGGIYNDLLPTERNSLIAKMEGLVKHRKDEDLHLMMIARNESEAEVYRKVMDGQMSPSDLEEANARGGLSAPFTKAALEVLENPKQFLKGTHSVPYFQLVRGLLKRGQNPTLEKISLLEGVRDGIISKQEATHIFENMAVPSKGDQKETLQNQLANQNKSSRQKVLDQWETDLANLKQKKAWWVSAWDHIMHHTDNEDQQSEMGKELNRRASNGKLNGEEIPKEASKIVSEDILRKYPDISSWPKEGKVKHDSKTGRYYRFYPDGSYHEITEQEANAKPR